VNDACVLAAKPNIHGSLFQFEGQATVFLPGKGCYRCLYPTPPPPGSVPSCQQAGVMGVVAGTIGLLQATEALKLILGIGRPLTGYLLAYNALQAEFTKLKVQRNPACPVCGDHPTITQLVDYEEFCGVRAVGR
jgi:molybdopterin/thiamine biosynthesis adenylyltransferase